MLSKNKTDPVTVIIIFLILVFVYFLLRNQGFIS